MSLKRSAVKRGPQTRHASRSGNPNNKAPVSERFRFKDDSSRPLPNRSRSGHCTEIYFLFEMCRLWAEPEAGQLQLHMSTLKVFNQRQALRGESPHFSLIHYALRVHFLTPFICIEYFLNVNWHYLDCKMSENHNLSQSLPCILNHYSFSQLSCLNINLNII